MWKGIRQNRPCVTVNIHFPKQKIDQRNGQKDQARNAKQKVCGRIEVTKSLRKRKPGCEEWFLNPENLRHSTCPANALADVRGQALGCEPRSQRKVDIGCVPADALHAQGSVRI